MDVKIEDSWKKALNEEFNQPYFKELTEFVKSEYQQYTIFPSKSQIFRAFDECPFDKVKVVIFGQDPYHTKGMADGLCFSVPRGVSKLPPSLRNILTELETDLGIEQRTNGDLIYWANQGVLMLNTVLTVREGVADSHAGKGWEIFTDAVIRELNIRKKGVVYILWGSKALKKGANLDEENNLILTSPHPSPLSSYRGFFGSKPFSKTNEYLRLNSLKEISW